MPEEALLTQALRLQKLAEYIVVKAMQIERSEGKTWDELASHAGLTKQTAHRRWKRNEFYPKSLEKNRSQMQQELEYLHCKVGDLIQELDTSWTSTEDFRTMQNRLGELEDRVQRLEDRS